MIELFGGITGAPNTEELSRVGDNTLTIIREPIKSTFLLEYAEHAYIGNYNMWPKIKMYIEVKKSPWWFRNGVEATETERQTLAADQLPEIQAIIHILREKWNNISPKTLPDFHISPEGTLKKGIILGPLDDDLVFLAGIPNHR